MSPLILASTSAARRAMLENAGVELVCVPPGVDEAAVRDALRAEGAPARDVADVLAEAKAVKVSRGRPGLVLGADQTLATGDAIFDKPVDRDAARAQLLALRGRRHQLHAAAVLARDGAPIWRVVQTATLLVRPFTEAFLEAYLDREGERLLDCVGAYRLEGLGAQLFDEVAGDYFVVLGLPLLAVLGELRRQGALEP